MTEEEFWGTIDQRESGDCWEWTGFKDKFGYGQLRLKGYGGRILAHRGAWELVWGPIPEEMCILHECDNPACCNPEHLFLGTRADNNADRVAKGRTRTPQGSCHWKARLTEKDIPIIRKRISSGEKLKSIGLDYGVTRGTIESVKAGRTWKHVEEEGV